MLLFAFERSSGDSGTEDERGEWGCGELTNEADPHHKLTVIFSGAAFIRESDF